MASMAFDTLRYARRLKEVGVPEPQADVQAALMAEAFACCAESYADNLLTRDHFTEVLNARFAEQDARFEQRLGAMDSKVERRFSKLEGTQVLHTWMLGLITVAVVIPQLQAWLG
jgi:hypothetical protein